MTAPFPRARVTARLSLWPRLAFVLLIGLGAAGCVTTPLEDRNWTRVTTRHYDIASALSATDTARLAVEIEHFRSAVEYLWGRTIPAAPVRTRVYAFDDRGLGRPFALESQRSYLLSRTRGDVIVLRAGEGWAGDARGELKTAYARRLFENASPGILPPWYEEGLAQLASTIEIRGPGASVGRFPREHVARLRDAQWVPMERVVDAPDLGGWSSLERELFAAEAWALCHYLKLGESRREDADSDLRRYREKIRAGAAAGDAAREVFGDELQREVWRHISARELDSVSIRIPRVDPKPITRAMPSHEVREELGLLALEIGETERAERYFEGALADAPGSRRAWMGLGTLRESEGSSEESDALLHRALAAAPEDLEIHLALADALRARAARRSDPRERARLAALARSHYRHVLDAQPKLPGAHAGVAATYLIEGEDASKGRAPVRAALALLPGDASLRHLSASLAFAAGDAATAHTDANRLLARARSDRDFESVRTLLEPIHARASLP